MKVITALEHIEILPKVTIEKILVKKVDSSVGLSLMKNVLTSLAKSVLIA